MRAFGNLAGDSETNKTRVPNSHGQRTEVGCPGMPTYIFTNSTRPQTGHRLPSLFRQEGMQLKPHARHRGITTFTVEDSDQIAASTVSTKRKKTKHEQQFAISDCAQDLINVGPVKFVRANKDLYTFMVTPIQVQNSFASEAALSLQQPAANNRHIANYNRRPLVAYTVCRLQSSLFKQGLEC